ncbi:vWA-like protein [Leucogyrophana mollusca]|uniref:VWA-like protein n=1 Tax=Leucogyrophana mollusca TaxID=85980 RepID=A0ACB8BBW9_9AGAM|nr:vWA-like protein [Leucogyrophana mollusca]
MTYQSKPTSEGTYRIKVLDEDLFIESVPGSNAGLKLTSLSSTNTKQKWKLAKVSGKSDVWTIVSAEDQSGVTYYKTSETYWGYGYPLPHSGESQQWSIQERTSQGKTFSKIKLNGSPDPFDSCSPGSDAINFYYDHPTVSSGPKQCYVFELLPDEKPPSALDVIFLQDSTGSQQPYIDSARAEIAQICATLASTGQFAPNDFRVGLIAFRDHPPQDNSFVTQVYPLTSDVSLVEANLSGFIATGGGDGPEAQSDALADALVANWRDDATKVVILVTDSPPHGILEEGDGFPGGCPLQNDPLHIANQMARLGITLYVVACEPTLSEYYKKAHDFYVGLTAKTGGKLVPLGDANALSDYIVGTVTEALGAEALVQKYDAEIRKQASLTADAAEISAKLYKDLEAAGVQLNTFVVEDIYESNEQARQNAQTWFQADKLADARSKIQVVKFLLLDAQNVTLTSVRIQTDGPRIVEKYRDGGQQPVALKQQAISLDQVTHIQP